MSKYHLQSRDTILDNAKQEIGRLLFQYKRMIVKEEQIDHDVKKKLLEVEEYKDKLIAKIECSSEYVKQLIQSVFMKYRKLLQDKVGEDLSEIVCDYGKVGIKEGRRAVVLDERYNEADIVEELERRHMEQFVVHKKSLNKQLVLRSYTDDFIVQSLNEIGISAATKEEFFIKEK